MIVRLTLCLKIIIVVLLLSSCDFIGKGELDFSEYGEAAHLSIETLEEWIELSDHILTGEQIASRPYDTYLEYDIQVREQFKGSVTDSVIQVFSAVPLASIGRM
ncbi:hypothetical protein [Xylanibacillus composti]|uniref:hypothetical protein n=1 Tax=Xylanibacillus composti TaxID=1572762 RepID=UPI001BCD05AA|nr:hypothetical protein [Xylanibacillus composti]